jgi:hypothetical protein
MTLNVLTVKKVQDVKLAVSIASRHMEACGQLHAVAGTGGWVSPRASLGILEMRKITFP